VGQPPLTGEVEINRDPAVQSNVKFFASSDDREPRQEVASFSFDKPGQEPDAVWKSGMVQGHPFTFGLVPSTDFEVTLAAGADHGITYDEVKGTGYTAFAVIYKNGEEKEAARPAQIARITWSGPGGAVEGIEGNHRLTGRQVNIERAISVQVVLRPGNDGGRSTVLAQVRRTSDSGSSYRFPLTATPTDASGVAVVAGRYPVKRQITKGNVNAPVIAADGAPLATGILPRGASHIEVILRTGPAVSEITAVERMADGKVMFAIQTDRGRLTEPSQSSIKAVTWTNADGSKGRREVNQSAPQTLSPKRP
jgi:hypothetical protein